MKRARIEGLIAAALAAGAAFVLLTRMRGYPLLGWDTFPEIVSSRILGLADLLGTFSEQLAEGYYPFAFYRPVLNLSLAGDFAVWGVDPIGYHLTAAVLLAACGVALFGLARRLLGPDARLGPWTALVAFLLLPVHMEVMPLPSRRMDLLCALFSSLALATQVPRVDRRGISGSGLSLLFTALAVGSKEAGVALVPLIFLVVLFRGPTAPLWERCRVAARVARPHLAVVALIFVARFVAIGGLGGHATTSLTGAVTRFPTMLSLTLVRLSMLWSSDRDPIGPGWLYAGSGVAVLLLVAVALPLLRGDAPRRSARSETRPARVAAALGLSWIVMLAVIYAATGLLQPWYLLLPGQALALVVGAGAHHLAGSLVGRARVPAAAGLSIIALWIGLEARYSPILHGYAHWDRAAAAAESYLELLAGRIEANPDGGIISVPPPPVFVRVDPNPLGVTRATALHVYSLPAWALLEFPDRRIEFRHPMLRRDVSGPEPGKLIVRVRDEAPQEGARPHPAPPVPERVAQWLAPVDDEASHPILVRCRHNSPGRGGAILIASRDARGVRIPGPRLKPGWNGAGHPVGDEPRVDEEGQESGRAAESLHLSAGSGPAPARTAAAPRRRS